jgi:SAM-dependent methyltransferase
MLKVDWLVDLVEGDWDTGFTSPYASDRYRAIAPATALRALGHRVRVLPMAKWDASYEGRERPDLLVVAKLFRRGDADFDELAQRILRGVAAARELGIKVVADYCDNLFDNPDTGAYWRALCGAVDHCVASSEELERQLRERCGVRLSVIGDPIAAPHGKPRVYRRPPAVHRMLQRWLGGRHGPERLNLVWYGHPTNFPPVLAWAQQLISFGERQPWILKLVTRPSPKPERLIQEFNARHAPRCVLQLVHWSEPTQWEAVDEAHVVLIPSDTQSAISRAKSNNRLTDALTAGRFVIASPVPAYLPYGDCTAITDDPLAALDAYLSDPDAALAKVAAGQLLAEQRASAHVITALWLAALESALASAAPSPLPAARDGSSAPAVAVRLNLGCGDKILPGYVNVDVVEARAGKKPDVICDLHDLSAFPDNHADEILAVHVVEHFWRWEIEGILREWTRVLKPGGRMVLECPNLAAACEAFLADPFGGSQPDGRGQRTMWVFYGDPQWHDPLMVHRWGYTPASLAALMTSAGLDSARQEPAQFKLREPRDMRVVAEKPLSPSSDASQARTR